MEPITLGAVVVSAAGSLIAAATLKGSGTLTNAAYAKYEALRDAVLGGEESATLSQIEKSGDLVDEAAVRLGSDIRQTVAGKINEVSALTEDLKGAIAGDPASVRELEEKGVSIRWVDARLDLEIKDIQTTRGIKIENLRSTEGSVRIEGLRGASDPKQ